MVADIGRAPDNEELDEEDAGINEVGIAGEVAIEVAEDAGDVEDTWIKLETPGTRNA